MRILFCLLTLPLFAAAAELSVKPAAEITLDTIAGQFYQLQIKRGSVWQDIGLGIEGTGNPIQQLQPAGDYRLITSQAKWVKVWADEFDEADLDYSKWSKEENNYGGGNFERQAYRADSKYCFVKNGNLNIAVHRDPHTTSDGKTQPYSSARIRTLKRGDWKYGRFEIRAKLPDGQGIWPAIWMLPSESKYGGWAAGGEIDILESRGSAVHETTSALHFGGPWPRNTHLEQSFQFPAQDAAETFHIYAIEWNADEIKWFVDGQLWKTRTRSEWFSEAARDNPSAPFDQPFHLILNVAVDGRFFEKTTQRADLLPNSAFPQTMLVDYVRVYQWAD